MSKFDKNHNILSIKIIYLQGKLKKRNQSEKIYLQYILIYLTKHLYPEYVKKLPKQQEKWNPPPKKNMPKAWVLHNREYPNGN